MNTTIRIELPSDEFFRAVHDGMANKHLSSYSGISDRPVEDVVITDDGRYAVVHGDIPVPKPKPKTVTT